MRRPTATQGLAGVAVTLTCTALGVEYSNIWRRGRAPLPAEADRVSEAAAEAALETVEVAVAGYRGGSPRENALLNLLTAYAGAAGIARASTHRIRTRG